MFRRRKRIAIIGAGHNGLIAAAYLAKKHEVTVFESRDTIGGCASSEQMWDSFCISPAAYVLSLLDPLIIEELNLKKHGLRILPRTPSSFTPDLPARGLILCGDPYKDYASIAQYSQKDAEKFSLYEQMLTRVAVAIEPMLQATPPVSDGIKDLKKIWPLRKAIRDSNPSEVLDVLTASATSILNRWFESETLKATLATDAIIGFFAPPSHPGSAYVLLHHVMGMAGGARGKWAYIQGGMGSLADAIWKECDARVGQRFQLKTNSPVTEICVSSGRVKALILNGSAGQPFDAVVSSVDANLTFNKLLTHNTKQSLPAQFVNDINNIDYSSASAKINLALSGLPQFPGHGPEVCNGTIHISPSLAYIERAYFDAAVLGKHSDQPVLEITIPSAVDKTLAPSGHHVMSMFVQYVPYKLAEGEWDHKKRMALFEACMKMLEWYAPGVRELVMHKQVLTPVDLERIYGLTGGNIFQGAMDFSNLFMARPALGWADYRTPIKGLYLCGAAAHPGGGVMGLAGKNAAREILRDL